MPNLVLLKADLTHIMIAELAEAGSAAQLAHKNGKVALASSG